MESILARKVHRSLEPYHGLVYFAPEAFARYAALGVEGFGGYFPSRAAAMGAVGPEVVVATFLNFRPSLVHDALPSAWSAAPPSAWLEARLAAVDEALRGAVGEELLLSDAVARAASLAGEAASVAAEHADGRPLGLAHAAVPRPSEPHLALWHSITVLREHRGDGHVACLVESGIDASMADREMFDGRGCIDCNGTGYHGREAIVELLDMSDRIRQLILDRRPAHEIRLAAREEGMHSLRESAVEKLLAGKTSLREINKVTFVD